MARRYLGHGITNAQGIATLDHDPIDGEPMAHSYTGVGAGKVDIVAKNGSLVSEPYALWDVIKYDVGTIANHTDIWTGNEDTTFERLTDYSRISEKTAGTTALIHTAFNSGSIIEFDVRIGGSTNGNFFYLLQSSTGRRTVSVTDVAGSGAQVNTWYSLRMTITEGNIHVENLTNEHEKDISFTGNYNRVELLTGLDITTVDFRNFKIY